MPNNILPEGDDQKWKKEVDRELDRLQRIIAQLEEKIRRFS
jgi:hypothetical protein